MQCHVDPCQPAYVDHLPPLCLRICLQIWLAALAVGLLPSGRHLCHAGTLQPPEPLSILSIAFVAIALTPSPSKSPALSCSAAWRRAGAVPQQPSDARLLSPPS